MAKIEPWEQRIREQAEELAMKLNNAFPYALMLHEDARARDPDHVPVVYPEDASSLSRLVGRARKLLNVGEAINTAIVADEEGDEDALKKAMQVLTEFTEGLAVKLAWVKRVDGYVLSREHMASEEDYPFLATVLMLGFADYWERYKDIVHLGVCRQCSTVYVKAKHGRKMRYCSRACQQKAYRKRRKEKES